MAINFLSFDFTCFPHADHTTISHLTCRHSELHDPHLCCDDTETVHRSSFRRSFRTRSGIEG